MITEAGIFQKVGLWLVLVPLTAGKLNANSSSGDVGISCKASDIDLKVSSGDIVLNQEGMGGSVNIKSSSGTVDYTQTGSNDQIIIKSGHLKPQCPSVEAGPLAHG